MESVECLKASLPIFAVVGVTWVGVSALNHDIDGVVISTVIGAICLLAGTQLSALKRFLEA